MTLTNITTMVSRMGTGSKNNGRMPKEWTDATPDHLRKWARKICMAAANDEIAKLQLSAVFMKNLLADEAAQTAGKDLLAADRRRGSEGRPNLVRFRSKVEAITTHVQ